MSQHDMNIANQGFPAFRSDLNNALAALASTSAGATAPSTTFAQQLWYDSTANLLKMRNTDNDAWITLAYFDQTNDEWEIRSAVIQAVDSAGVVIKTDDGTTRLTIADDGTVTVAGTLDVDTINEKTSAAGVTIDGVLLKDSKIAKSGLPAGSVLQVVQGSTNTQVSNSTTSFSDTGLTASITPTSASSKILVIVDQQTRTVRSSGAQYGGIRLVRSGSVIFGPVADATGPYEFGVETGGTSAGAYGRYSIVYLDNPSTTSSTTYKTQGRPYYATSGGLMTFQTNSVVDGTSTITLMEIAG